jgi:uncharacterized membrane protein YraQ (UPF0718 family)
MSSSVSAAPAYSLPEDSSKPAVRTIQVVTVIVLALAMGSYFWVDSRYPALLKKLHAGKSVKVTAAITFDAVLPVNPSMPLPTRIVRTSANWLWANRIGMSFGIGFGAVMLTLLPMFSRRRLQSPVANTLLGVVAGAPLGVCANCVAPIGRGLARSGASPNTVLATMISSPTLNVVVLAMVFSVFPLPVAMTKLATVVALLAFVPWLAPKAEPEFVCVLPENRAGQAGSAGSAFVLFLKNLGKMIAFTVPLMVLAAVLGAISVELLPAASLPVQVSLIGIVLVALIGTFLPVPMAFDVAVAFVLMSRGVPMPYVVTLLCTLGIFSVYSFLILGRTWSWRSAAKVYGAVTVLGILAGLGTAIAQHSF